MPEDKVEKAKPKTPEELAEEEAKKAAKEPETYPPKEEKKAEDVAPKWAVELSAKIDKLADAILRSAVPEKEKADKYPKPGEEEKPEEKKAKEPEKPEKPEEGKAKEPEKYPYATEEKLNNMIENAISSAVGPAVEKAIAKRFTEEPIEKRAKAPGTNTEEKELSLEDIGKMSFKEIHDQAAKRGA